MADEETGTGNTHEENAAILLEHAEDMVEDEDHLQASEKIWGAVAHTLAEIGEQHGWPHANNFDLGNIAYYLRQVVGDDTMGTAYRSARSFHDNFYKDEFSLAEIDEGVADAEELIRKLKAAAEAVANGARPPGKARTPNELQGQITQAMDRKFRAALSEQGLEGGTAARGARILGVGVRGGAEDLSFRIGQRRRRVTLGDDGRPQVGGRFDPQVLVVKARNRFWGRR
ncbi:MAG: hypothetical protein F4X54_07590 [Chloroflexi bacterium]|nr:hypothetical protein [Chloroflexota bacterium]